MKIRMKREHGGGEVQPSRLQDRSYQTQLYFGRLRVPPVVSHSLPNKINIQPSSPYTCFTLFRHHLQATWPLTGLLVPAQCVHIVSQKQCVNLPIKERNFGIVPATPSRRKGCCTATHWRENTTSSFRSKLREGETYLKSYCSFT